MDYTQHRSHHSLRRPDHRPDLAKPMRLDFTAEATRHTQLRALKSAPRLKPNGSTTIVSRKAQQSLTGVIAPFDVQSTPEAGAAPLHTCLPCRGRMLHGCHGRLSSSKPHRKPERLHCTRVFEGAANCSTGVIAPFVVKTLPEAGAAPLHTCLRRRGKLLHGSRRAFRRQDHTRSRSGSTALVSPMAREMTRTHSHTQKAQRFLCLCLAFFVAFSSSCCSSRRRASALRSAKAIPASSASRWAVSTSARAAASTSWAGFNLCKQLRHILMSNTTASFRGR